MLHDKLVTISLRREVLAGLTTFVTMAYISVVNPVVLGGAGVPFQQAFTATIIATVVGTLLMALYANYPIAIAPGMGLNAYFAYSVASSHHGINYHVAFSAVFLAAIIFVLLSLTPLRTHLINAIPENLKYAITAGIGLFIAFIGLRMTGIVRADPTNLVALGNLHAPQVLLALAGLIFTVILMSLQVPGAIFIGIVFITLITLITGQLTFTGIAALPRLPEGLLAYNPVTAIADTLHYGLYGAIFSFVLVTIFDTTGTVLGVSRQAGLMVDGKLPRAERAFLADSIATLVGSIFGTSPTSAYVESAAGVAVGGRTGITALVVAILFILTAFFSPLISALSAVAAITGPALIIVGSLMIGQIQHIHWEHFDEAFPAFITILIMPLSSSIADGIALGFIFYPIPKLVTGHWREVHPLVYIFAILFLCQLLLFSR
ncbi:NCS2 family permease [Dictyobacter arantiisoli]|uniref:Guanine permease n=1 Tax=Dictyobacter arantiisoli TaxID=2014874 RepID=A0A5A5TDN5_9CHLR|nr:NCS2 family permease [Dictyobacter arantiisoli]GCF09651.1 guanine permease [Dictyobacter arantiisoli]